MARKHKSKTKVVNTDEAMAIKAATTSATKPPASSSPLPPPASGTGNFIDDLLPPEPGMKDLSTVRVLAIGAALLTVGTLGFHSLPGMMSKGLYADKEDGDGGSHWVNSFYCATMTLTTVGFGDICPGNTDAVGKVFLLAFSFASLGFFCGPVVQLGAAWRHAIPGGLPVLGSFVLTLGVMVFTMAEGLDQFEAIYASVITGTTIGYGDVTPRTDAGKIAVALYAIVSQQAMGALLDPARNWLEQMCQRAKPKTKLRAKRD